MGFVEGGLPLSGVTRISMPVMGVNPSRPVIQDRDTVVSVNAVTMRLVTGSAGTMCVYVCVCREREREREREGGGEREREIEIC